MRSTNYSSHRLFYKTDRAVGDYSLSGDEALSAAPFSNQIPMAGYFGVPEINIVATGNTPAVLPDIEGALKFYLVHREERRLDDPNGTLIAQFRRRLVFTAPFTLGTFAGLSGGVVSANHRYADTIGTITYSTWGQHLIDDLGLKVKSSPSTGANKIASISVPDCLDAHSVLLDIDLQDGDVTFLNALVQLGG